MDDEFGFVGRIVHSGAVKSGVRQWKNPSKKVYISAIVADFFLQKLNILQRRIRAIGLYAANSVTVFG